MYPVLLYPVIHRIITQFSEALAVAKENIAKSQGLQKRYYDRGSSTRTHPDVPPVSFADLESKLNELTTLLSATRPNFTCIKDLARDLLSSTSYLHQRFFFISLNLARPLCKEFLSVHVIALVDLEVAKADLAKAVESCARRIDSKT